MHDVDRSAAHQQIIKLRLISEFIDPVKVDQEKGAPGSGDIWRR
jgi:hypothetical protein